MIDTYIDENKAMIRRMFGEYQSPEESPSNDHKGRGGSFTTYDGTPLKRHTRNKRASYANGGRFGNEVSRYVIEVASSAS